MRSTDINVPVSHAAVGLFREVMGFDFGAPASRARAVAGCPRKADNPIDTIAIVDKVPAGMCREILERALNWSPA